MAKSEEKGGIIYKIIDGSDEKFLDSIMDSAWDNFICHEPLHVGIGFTNRSKSERKSYLNLLRGFGNSGISVVAIDQA